MNQLPHRSFSSALIWIGAVGDVAVKILRDRYFGRKGAPVLRDFDVLLLKDDFATVIGDFCGALLPFNLVKAAALNTRLKRRPIFFFLSLLFLRRTVD
jgi:hypothetical protein